MATATLQRTQETTSSWSAIFPTEQLSEQQSALFVKKLLAVAVSNIAYLRAIFPEHAFGDRCLEDLNLKILRDDSTCPGACQVIKWVKGCFDALDKKYLRMLVIGIFVDPDNPDTVIESYTFKFSYSEQGGIDIYRNGKKIANAHNVTETKKATIRLLRTIVVLTQTLQSLPDDVMMTMKLLYYDDVTPTDYEPPGFKAAQSDSFKFEEEPTNIKVGDVSTPFHTLKMRIKTDSKQFEMKEEDPSQEEAEETQGNENETENMEIGQNSQEPLVLPERDIVLKRKEEDDAETNVYDFEDELPETDNLLLKDRKMQKVETSKAKVPTEMPTIPGSGGKAVDTTGSQRSQMSTEQDLGVRCPCGCNEDDGLMILCAVCKYWQHGICFLVQNEDDAPQPHICDICANLEDPKKQATDPYLTGLSSIGVQATCLWRRTLIATAEMNRVLGPSLSRRLGVEITVAQGLLNRLEKEGFIRNPGKGKRLGKMVDKEKIIKEGIPKYLKKKSLNKDNASLQKETDKIKNEKDTENIAEQQKDKVEVEIKEKITKLAEMTEEISLTKSKKRKGSKKTKENDKQMRRSPKLAEETNNGQFAQKRRGRKRAISRVDGAEEFEVCDSQDVYEAERQKRKASVASRAIMV